MALAARSLGLPVVTHESDLTPGLANRLIARGCAAVLTSFPETAQKFKNGIWTGPPPTAGTAVREQDAGARQIRPDGGKAGAAHLRGGCGSRALNEAADGATERILSIFDVVHIRGDEGQARPGYVPLAYEPDMASAYACADFVLARAGSNTLFELLALKIDIRIACRLPTSARAATSRKTPPILNGAGWCGYCPKRRSRPTRFLPPYKSLPPTPVCAALWRSTAPPSAMPPSSALSARRWENEKLKTDAASQRGRRHKYPRAKHVVFHFRA